MSNYTPPTPTELRALLDQWQLHPREAAALVAHKSPRMIYRYLAGDGRMSYPMLYVLAHQMTGRGLEPGRWRATLALDKKDPAQGGVNGARTGGGGGDTGR